MQAYRIRYANTLREMADVPFLLWEYFAIASMPRWATAYPSCGRFIRFFIPV
jgi:hypothetical protein